MDMLKVFEEKRKNYDKNNRQRVIFENIKDNGDGTKTIDILKVNDQLRREALENE